MNTTHSYHLQCHTNRVHLCTLLIMTISTRFDNEPEVCVEYMIKYRRKGFESRLFSLWVEHFPLLCGGTHEDWWRSLFLFFFRGRDTHRQCFSVIKIKYTNILSEMQYISIHSFNSRNVSLKSHVRNGKKTSGIYCFIFYINTGRIVKKLILKI